MDRRELAAIFAGGALGTLARAGLAEALVHDVTTWPWPTFIANVVSVFVLGYVATRLPLSGYRRPFFATGLCGGLSTFSTVQVEVVQMLDAGVYGLAAAYIAGSVVAGLLGIHIATVAVRRLRLRG